jgi:hypothetical protein
VDLVRGEGAKEDGKHAKLKRKFRNTRDYPQIKEGKKRKGEGKDAGKQVTASGFPMEEKSN